MSYESVSYAVPDWLKWSSNLLPCISSSSSQMIFFLFIQYCFWIPVLSHWWNQSASQIQTQPHQVLHKILHAELAAISFPLAYKVTCSAPFRSAVLATSIAAFPIPMLPHFFLNCMSKHLPDNQYQNARVPRHSPWIPRFLGFHVPVPSKYAGISVSKQVFDFKTAPIVVFGPLDADCSIRFACSSAHLGRRNSGIPYCMIPPILSFHSNTVTPYPCCARTWSFRRSCSSCNLLLLLLFLLRFSYAPDTYLKYNAQCWKNVLHFLSPQYAMSCTLFLMIADCRTDYRHWIILKQFFPCLHQTIFLEHLNDMRNRSMNRTSLLTHRFLAIQTSVCFINNM